MSLTSTLGYSSQSLSDPAQLSIDVSFVHPSSAHHPPCRTGSLWKRRIASWPRWLLHILTRSLYVSLRNLLILTGVSLPSHLQFSANIFYAPCPPFSSSHPISERQIFRCRHHKEGGAFSQHSCLLLNPWIRCAFSSSRQDCFHLCLGCCERCLGPV